MPLWGKTDQAATANSTTTKISTTGAPLNSHLLVNAGGGVAAHYGNTSGTRAGNTVNMFGNVSSGAFVSGQAVGVFGVDTTETGVSGKVAHAGWQLRRVGTGGVSTISYTGTATGYANTDVITVASPVAGGNATVTMTTNSTGGALTLTVGTKGFGFFNVNAAANVVVANSTGGATAGSGATFLPVIGGRAGRVTNETLVAMGTITSDASDDTQFPDS